MSFEGYLRLVWPAILVFVVVIFVLWATTRIGLKQVPEQYQTKVKTGRNMAMLACTVILLVWLAISAGQNLFPRTDLDRSDLNQQNQQWEQEHSK